MIDSQAHSIETWNVGDRLDGAEAIAAYLSRKPRWVYQAREDGWSVPIRKRDGLGIYAFKSELDAWMRAPETLPVKKPR